MKRFFFLVCVIPACSPAMGGPLGLLCRTRSPDCAGGNCASCAAQTPARIPALSVGTAAPRAAILAVPLGAVPATVTADLAALDADQGATAAAVIADAASDQSVAAAAAQKAQTAGALNAAQTAQAAQLAQTIADIQAAYGVTANAARAMVENMKFARTPTVPPVGTAERVGPLRRLIGRLRARRG